MISENIISFKNVTKKYGSQTILDDLNFEIKKNKITTILGFSGAGKSTLLKHILGLSAPTRGEITCLGQDITQLDDFSLKEFIYIQNYHLHETNPSAIKKLQFSQ